MYNPFSVYTVIPWSIVFNVSEALIFMVCDVLIGRANDTIRGAICLSLFIINFVYMLYTVIIHFSVFKRWRLARKDKRHPVTFVDLFNILIGASLTWVWLFIGLYFIDHSLYTDVLLSGDFFFNVYMKFYAFTVIALNGGVSTIQPIVTISEVAHGLAVLYYQCITVLILAGFLTYLLDSSTSS